VSSRSQLPSRRRASARRGRSQMRTLAGMALLLSPIAGCAVGPDFLEPTAPISNKFAGANGGAIKTRSPDYQSWWRAFRDPGLNQLVDMAYNQNLTLLSAATRVLEARAALGIAIGEFFPQVQQAEGTLTDNRTSAATPPERIALIRIISCGGEEIGALLRRELDEDFSDCRPEAWVKTNLARLRGRAQRRAASRRHPSRTLENDDVDRRASVARADCAHCARRPHQRRLLSRICGENVR
jgi:hypothetical protein